MPEGETLRIPSANEFSPGVIDLQRVLEIVSEHRGNRGKLIEAIRAEYFSEAAEKLSASPEKRGEQQRKRANNVLIGLSSYGLYSRKTCDLTGTGRTFLDICDAALLKERFASYILKDLNGIQVLQAVRDLQSRSEKVTKASLALELRKLGFVSAQGGEIPLNTTDHLQLINWLRKAGVILENYKINEPEFSRLAGIGSETLDLLRALDKKQLAFLQTLKAHSEIHGEKADFTRNILRKCQIQHGSIFRETDQLPRVLFKPLEEMGFIKRSGRGSGRGGSSGQIAVTKKLIEMDSAVFSLPKTDGIPAEVRSRLNTPFESIYKDLSSADSFIKGIALEILAVRLTYELGLIPLRFRERSRDTAGAEVDLISEGAHLHFSRWLIQCKNTKKVDLSALAKEVGMAVLLKAHVIVLVTTGTFASSVVEYAQGLAEGTPLQSVLVDKDVLKAYREHGVTALLDFFYTFAKETMRVKRAQISAGEN